MLNTILGAFSSGVAASTSSYESIASATGTGSSDTITFTSIPSTYTHLQIRGIAKVTALQRSSLLRVRLNGDSGTNYTQHRLTGDGATAAASGATAQTGPSFRDSIAGSQTSLPDMANIMGVAIIDIHDYASTTKNKTIRGIAGVDGNYSSVDFEINLMSGLWIDTSAVTSVSLVSNDPFTTTTTFALYGIKG